MLSRSFIGFVAGWMGWCITFGLLAMNWHPSTKLVESPFWIANREAARELDASLRLLSSPAPEFNGNITWNQVISELDQIHPISIGLIASLKGVVELDKPYRFETQYKGQPLGEWLNYVLRRDGLSMAFKGSSWVIVDEDDVDQCLLKRCYPIPQGEIYGYENLINVLANEEANIQMIHNDVQPFFVVDTSMDVHVEIENLLEPLRSATGIQSEPSRLRRLEEALMNRFTGDSAITSNCFGHR